MHLRDLYLDLLERTLTGVILEDMPALRKQFAHVCADIAGAAGDEDVHFHFGLRTECMLSQPLSLTHFKTAGFLSFIPAPLRQLFCLVARRYWGKYPV